MYAALRPLMFSLDAERAHHLAIKALSSPLARLASQRIPDSPVEVMGLTFPNPVGLAAGLDKDGKAIDGLAGLGFGFVEIGTVTPKPQAGNDKPRLFRLPEAEAIINRMGFNNDGVDALMQRVERSSYQGILGINIGKNKNTPADKAVDDYIACLERVYSKASYVTVNLSSPNTPGLRDLQFGEPLRALLGTLKERQKALSDQHGKYVPLAVKIAPDMADDDIKQVARDLVAMGIDGVIATNTTVERDAVKGLPHGQEQGGLSGAPLRKASTCVVSVLAEELGGALPIIGVGGITDADAAVEKIRAGASLVQIYSGFIYRGPALVAECAKALAVRSANSRC